MGGEFLGMTRASDDAGGTPPARVAVIIPSYRVTRHVLDVIARVPDCVQRIYVVDDACPERSGEYVATHCRDPRVKVVHNPVNLGVGGAVITGYLRAIEDGADVLVKIDGDGQMDPALVPAFLEPILGGHADYAKGNRFYDLSKISSMPAARLVGNAALSFLSKLSTGYWDLFDPTNGYTALHAAVAKRLSLEKVSKRYFFETDMLFRLGTIRAVVVDVPMDSHYGDEVSGLRISRIVGEFAAKHARNFGKRIFYTYFLRDMSLASLELLAGIGLLGFGTIYGLVNWVQAEAAQSVTSAGTVMLAGLPVLAGLQFILAFLGYDIASVPRSPIHRSHLNRRPR